MKRVVLHLLCWAAVAGAQMAAPTTVAVAAGPLGWVQVGGVFSGFGEWQGRPLPGDAATHADFTNALVIAQKASGAVQFYVQAGAYNIAILGTPFLSAADSVRALFGPAPVAYLQLPLGAHVSLRAGVLPTLIGAESTFTFQNANVLRGLLWNQENDVNRGVQLNAAAGRWSGTLSWNDGYYSGRYTWLTAALNWAVTGSQTVSVTAGGNWSHTAFRTAATPVQNNSRLVDVIYSFHGGGWTLQPYLQYTRVPASAAAGVGAGADTRGAALLAGRQFGPNWRLAVRVEGIASTGSAARGSVNLLYGPGSGAVSATLTPGWQNQHSFLRGDLGLVTAAHITAGDAFGRTGADRRQFRAVMEAGLVF
jgi:hypothetical protein